MVELSFTMDELMKECAHQVSLVLRKLHERGGDYGVLVLDVLGEDGAAVQTTTKALRNYYAWKAGISREFREDHYQDFAGYAILELARFALYEKRRNEDADLPSGTD